ncbi:hypothetical protein PENSPDRAFT_661433 [Peniophora sp. CONT]|nr:hypothetical protein PENSPDRAFT_661433 [Peniophora sp. CONT]
MTVPKPVDLTYELPPAVKKLHEGWMGTLQSGAVVSSIIAGVEAQLLVFYNDKGSFGTPDTDPPSVIQVVLEILTYIALVCSVSATITSLLLTDEFGEIPTRSARGRDARTEGGQFAGTDFTILRSFRLRRGSEIVMYHWLFSILIATLCTIISTAIFVIMQKPLAAQVIVTTVTILSVLPILWYFLGSGND